MMDMERSMGLQGLSRAERDIYCAASDISDSHQGVDTTFLLKHALVTGVSRPTFFRALKSLIEKGYLSPTDGSGRGNYTVKNSK